VHAVAREKAIGDPPLWVKHGVGLGCARVGKRRGKRYKWGEREREETRGRDRGRSRERERERTQVEDTGEVGKKVEDVGENGGKKGNVFK